MSQKICTKTSDCNEGICWEGFCVKPMIEGNLCDENTPCPVAGKDEAGNILPQQICALGRCRNPCKTLGADCYSYGKDDNVFLLEECLTIDDCASTSQYCHKTSLVTKGQCISRGKEGSWCPKEYDGSTFVCEDDTICFAEMCRPLCNAEIKCPEKYVCHEIEHTSGTFNIKSHLGFCIPENDAFYCRQDFPVYAMVGIGGAAFSMLTAFTTFLAFACAAKKIKKRKQKKLNAPISNAPLPESSEEESDEESE